MLPQKVFSTLEILTLLVVNVPLDFTGTCRGLISRWLRYLSNLFCRKKKTSVRRMWIFSFHPTEVPTETRFWHISTLGLKVLFEDDGKSHSTTGAMKQTALVQFLSLATPPPPSPPCAPQSTSPMEGGSLNAPSALRFGWAATRVLCSKFSPAGVKGGSPISFF